MMAILRAMERVEDPEFSERMNAALGTAAQGDIERAILLVDDLETQLRERLDDDDGDAVFMLWLARRNKANWLSELGRIDEAVEACASCVPLAVAAWGMLDERTLMIRNSMVFWMIETGGRREADRQAKALLADAEQVLAPDDVLLDAIRNNAGWAAAGAGRRGTAEDLLQELLAEYEDRGAGGDEAAMKTRNNLASFYENELEWEKAAKLHEKQAVMWRLRGPGSRENALWAENSHAYCMLLAGLKEEAAEIWTKVVEEAESFLGPDAPLVFEILGVRASIAISEGNREEALKYVERLQTLARQNGDGAMLQQLVRLANYCREELDGREPGIAMIPAS